MNPSEQSLNRSVGKKHRFKNELKADSYKVKHINDILCVDILAIRYVTYDGSCALSTV